MALIQKTEILLSGPMTAEKDNGEIFSCYEVIEKGLIKFNPDNFAATPISVVCKSDGETKTFTQLDNGMMTFVINVEFSQYNGQ